MKVLEAKNEKLKFLYNSGNGIRENYKKIV